jgi:hypothetical protein
MRRKPYFIIGWILFSLAGMSLALLKTPTIHHLVLFVSPATACRGV